MSSSSIIRVFIGSQRAKELTSSNKIANHSLVIFRLNQFASQLLVMTFIDEWARISDLLWYNHMQNAGHYGASLCEGAALL